MVLLRASCLYGFHVTASIRAVRPEKRLFVLVVRWPMMNHDWSSRWNQYAFDVLDRQAHSSPGNPSEQLPPPNIHRGASTRNPCRSIASSALHGIVLCILLIQVRCLRYSTSPLVSLLGPLAAPILVQVLRW